LSRSKAIRVEGEHYQIGLAGAHEQADSLPVDWTLQVCQRQHRLLVHMLSLGANRTIAGVSNERRSPRIE
jgi:hypothetical protein